MTDVPIRDAPTRDALIALHFQNDICHPEGRIPFSLDRGSSEAQQFLDASKRALGMSIPYGLAWRAGMFVHLNCKTNFRLFLEFLYAPS